MTNITTFNMPTEYRLELKTGIYVMVLWRRLHPRGLEVKCGITNLQRESANLRLVDKFCYLGDMLSVDENAEARIW